jgi:hypothetical protein
LKAPNAEERQMPKSAKCRRAPNAEEREMPAGAGQQRRKG